MTTESDKYAPSGESSASPHSSPETPVAAISAADTLPEIKPPTAGFIMQLFVVPALIVSVIILVWVLFSWLAQAGGNPHGYVEGINRGAKNSWLLANNLAQDLQAHPEYKQDRELAKKLATMLSDRLEDDLPKNSDEDLEYAHVEENEIRLRMFLCRAMGEFLVAEEILPVLLDAARPHRDDNQLEVRLAALEAIALLAENVRETEPLDPAQVMPMLTLAAEDESHRVGERAAFALATLGGDEAIAQLKELLIVVNHPNVRYNAATGLARHGDPACIEVLVEMLDPEEDAGVIVEKQPKRREEKRATNIKNALKAVDLMAKQNADHDLSALKEAVENLKTAKLDPMIERPVHLEAIAVLARLAERGK